MESIAWISLGLSFVCLGIIAVDIVMGRRQQMAVMNFVWPLTALYLSPFALWAYFSFGRARPDDRGQHDKPFWQSVFVSTTHCGAGCSLGDIGGEWCVFLFAWSIAGTTLWADYIADFVLAYILGIAFQYFAIVPMRHLSIGRGLMEALKADTLSITAFQVGMYAWMALDYFVIVHPHPHPNEARYWMWMQLAMIVGFVTSYPMNWFLLRKGIKEAM